MGERLEVLSEEECRRMLGCEHIGRVAVSLGALPVVFPVNYIVAGDEVLFFTADGTKLRAATDNRVVTFEVDHLDPAAQSGWSVLAVGTARERTEPAVLAGARAAGLRPWAAGDRPHLVGITAEIVSGRRVVAPDDQGNEEHRPAGNWAVGPRSPVTALAQRPVRVDEGSALGSASSVMREAGVSALLVGHDEAIVTEADVNRALRHGLGTDAPVGTIASIGLIGVDEDETVVDAAAVMLRHELRHLVLRNHRGVVTGVVALHDLVRVLLDAMDPAVWVVLRSMVVAGQGRASHEVGRPA